VFRKYIIFSLLAKRFRGPGEMASCAGLIWRPALEGTLSEKPMLSKFDSHWWTFHPFAELKSNISFETVM